jgi:hypothetical protein
VAIVNLGQQVYYSAQGPQEDSGYLSPCHAQTFESRRSDLIANRYFCALMDSPVQTQGLGKQPGNPDDATK